MRILIFTEISHAGGLDTFLVALLRHWPNREDEISLYCNSSHPGLGLLRERLDGLAHVASHGIPIYLDLVIRSARYPVLNGLRRAASPVLRAFFAVYSASRLYRMFRKENPDRVMIVAGGYPGGDSCRTAVLAWKAQAGGRPAAIFNIHNLAVSPGRFNPIEALLDCAVARSVRRIVTVSRACADSMKIRPRIWDTGKVEFILNGIETPHATGHPVGIRGQLQLGQNDRVVLMLATYEPRKGHAFLFEAFQQVVRRVPRARLIICGYGYPKEIDRVRSDLNASGLGEVVQLLDFRADAASLLAIADVLVVPSQAFESFGLTCVEAMAAGVPVVATNVGGLAEVVANADGGYATAPDDVEGFADRITRLLEDPGLHRDQSIRGRARYARLFGADRMAGEYAMLVREPLPA